MLAPYCKLDWILGRSLCRSKAMDAFWRMCLADTGIDAVRRD